MPARDRRVEIMLAAERLFTRGRFHEITLDDVVREARVGKGTVYRYFRDKEDLFFETATRGFDELCDLLRSHVPEDASFSMQLLAVCRQISGFFRARRELFRMMQSEEVRILPGSADLKAQWLLKRRTLVEAVGAVLAKGISESQVRRDVPAEVLAAFLLAMLRTRARELGDLPESARTLEMVVDLFCHGVAPRPAGRAARPPRRGASGRAAVAAKAKS